MHFSAKDVNAKNAAKHGQRLSKLSSEERPDAGCEIKRWKAAAEMLSFFILSTGYLQANKPRGLGWSPPVGEASRSDRGADRQTGVPNSWSGKMVI